MMLRFSTLSELGRGVFITGAAGTGKTHTLATLIETLAPGLNMRSFQVVPVLSAMHGARRRLLQRLMALQRSCRQKHVNLFVQVSTIDAFALSLVTRLHRKSEADFPNFDVGDFSPTHLAAAGAMRSESIKAVCSATYPFVVIDEFQDCKGSRLEFVRALAECVPMIIAADEFQALDADGSCPALEWCSDSLPRIDLGDMSARTKDIAVIATAKALRVGIPTRVELRRA
jgi:superfamily I DNA/RNA helicase